MFLIQDRSVFKVTKERGLEKTDHFFSALLED